MYKKKRPAGFDPTTPWRPNGVIPLHYDLCYEGWFRSTGLWVMSPTQFLFATSYITEGGFDPPASGL